MKIQNHEDGFRIWLRLCEFLRVAPMQRGPTGTKLPIWTLNAVKKFDTREHVLEVYGDKFSVEFHNDGTVEVRHNNWHCSYRFEDEQLPSEVEHSMKGVQHPDLGLDPSREIGRNDTDTD